MGSIRILSDSVINQIAAGEVIERPASVVKELLENSIDAKATHITVEVVKGGTEKITVTDDGGGMDEMDARLAFERHATSKIGGSEDLFRIKTLGFRGEALASIASVSQVVLQTKTVNSLGGVRLEMEGGKAPVVTGAGCSVGTKLEISNLFFNTPARKKFLKSEATEYRHILEMVQDLALAHPEIGFKFVSNGRTTFDLPKTEKLQARIGALLGKAVSDELMEVFYGGRDLQVSGFVGKPHLARATRKYQYLIMNGRAVQDNRLGYAVKEGYSNLIPSSQYPIFVLSVTMDPQKLDVNVHPRKLEVRLAEPQEMFRVVKSAVGAALARETMMRPMPLRDTTALEMPAFMRKETIKPTETKKIEVEEAGGDYDSSFAAVAPMPNFWGGTPHYTAPTPAYGASSSGPVSSMTREQLDARKAYLLQRRAERLAAQGQAAPPQEPSGTSTNPLFAPPSSSLPVHDPFMNATSSFTEDRPHGSLRPIAQIKNSYLIAEDDEGVVIVDQHAAHERVMLGKFRASEADRDIAKQPLLTPLQLTLDYREKALLEEHLDLLRSLGFDLNEFGGGTYTLDAIPDFLAKEDVDEVIRGFLDDLLNEQTPREAARRHEHILHTLACRAAAKFGRRLSTYEQEALLRSLLNSDGSSSCAHGRPTMIRLTFSELEQKFGRNG